MSPPAPLGDNRTTQYLSTRVHVYKRPKTCKKHGKYNVFTSSPISGGTKSHHKFGKNLPDVPLWGLLIVLGLGPPVWTPGEFVIGPIWVGCRTVP